MCYEVVRIYATGHVRCIQYDWNTIRQLSEFRQLLGIVRSLKRTDPPVHFPDLFKYQLIIERVS